MALTLLPAQGAKKAFNPADVALQPLFSWVLPDLCPLLCPARQLPQVRPASFSPLNVAASKPLTTTTFHDSHNSLIDAL